MKNATADQMIIASLKKRLSQALEGSAMLDSLHDSLCDKTDELTEENVQLKARISDLESALAHASR